MNRDKYLITLLHGLSQKQIFFLIWFAITGVFVMLMYSFYRRTTRSNFRRPQDGPAPRILVDARQLEKGEKKEIVVRGTKEPAVKR